MYAIRSYYVSGYFSDILIGSTNTLSFGIAIAATLLFFISLLLHELGHALAARREGISTSGIDLWLFGGVAKLSRDSNSPGEEFKVAAAGPAVTALIVVACIAIAAVASQTTSVIDTATFSGISTSVITSYSIHYTKLYDAMRSQLSRYRRPLSAP